MSTPESVFKSSAGRLIKYTPDHWMPLSRSLNSTESRDSIEVKGPQLFVRALDSVYISPSLSTLLVNWPLLMSTKAMFPSTCPSLPEVSVERATGCSIIPSITWRPSCSLTSWATSSTRAWLNASGISSERVDGRLSSRGILSASWGPSPSTRLPSPYIGSCKKSRELAQIDDKCISISSLFNSNL